MNKATLIKANSIFRKLFAIIILICTNYAAYSTLYQEKFDSINAVLEQPDISANNLLNAMIYKLEICQHVSTDSTSINKLYKKALELANKTNNHNAVIAIRYNYAIKIKSESNFSKAQKLLFETEKLLYPTDVAWSIKIKSEIAKTFSYLDNYDKAIQYLQEAEQIAISSNDKIDLFTVILTFAAVYIDKREPENAMTYLYSARDIAENYIGEQSKEAGQTYTYLGIAYYFLGDNDKATSFLIKSQEILNDIEDRRKICMNNIFIGNIYYRQNNNEKAIHYYRTALILSTQTNDKQLTCYIHIHLSDPYTKMKKYDLAISYLTIANAIAKEISSERSISKTNEKLAHIYICQNNIPKAKEMLAKNINNKHLNKYPRIAFGTQIALSEIYEKQKDYDRAETTLISALSLGNSMEQALDIHKRLEQIYSKTQNYKKALTHFNIYSQLTDSINDSNAEKKLLTMNMQRVFEKEKENIERNNRLSDKEKDIKIRKLKHSLLTITALLILISFLIVPIPSDTF
jgi:tetratricopeptide (TPR) repeat protein